MDMNQVHSVAIYPAIGVARVGSSPSEYFIGPTIPGIPAHDPDQFRDAAGRIKRQAAQFYIYALDKDGQVIGELNEKHGVKIDWRVDVANKKAAWYNFDIALDIPAAQGAYDSEGIATPNGQPVQSKLRNADFQGDDRKLLMIEAKAKHITGCNTNADGSHYHFVGEIGKPDRNGHRQEVYMGEIRTDELGRLLFLGGRGKSDSFTHPKKPQTTFANNEGWHDDMSDGPIDATVTLPNGKNLEADGAWVLTAPPNYAVGVQAFSTGYQLLEDVAAQKHPHLKKDCPSFYADIYPTLRQLSENQWVNAGVSVDLGWGSAYDFNHPSLIERLKDPSDINRPLRQTVFETFRNPNYEIMQPNTWPPLYGDAVSFNVNSSDPRAWFAITPLTYGYLEQWARGEFLVDEPIVPKTWEEMTPSEQAHGLTEAALEETLGGPFHPGCEFTWPMRHPMMYHDDSPFRIKRRAKAKEYFGETLDSEKALAPGGPLDGSSPGDLTKWMAVPWQTDTSSCLSAYRAFLGEYLPTFWPARVPNDVLTEEDFQVINSSTSSDDDKIAAFGPHARKKWLRGYIYDNNGHVLNQPSSVGTEKFTEKWDKIGIILKKQLEEENVLFPKEIWVETGRSLQEEQTPKLMATDAVPQRPDWVDQNPRKNR